MLQAQFYGRLWSADKCDNTLLMSFQVLNTQLAQSQDNAMVALMMEAPDCYENLKTVFNHSDMGIYSWIYYKLFHHNF